MSIEDCAALVEKADPVRFRATMSAPPDKRAGLFALYAFNVEMSRIPWSVAEPMLAQIRLQYWRDQVATAFQGKTCDPHPVMTPLSEVIDTGRLPEADFQAMIVARRWEVHSEPFADQAALNTYLMDTGGRLMAMAARLLAVKDDHDTAIRQYGAAASLAAFFVAVPKLKARGRHPLPDDSPEHLRDLARTALVQLDDAGSPHRQRMAAAMPAFLTVTEARPILRQVVHDPSRVLAGTLERSEFRQRLRALTCQIRCYGSHGLTL